MTFSQPATTLIRRRYSCRNYQGVPIKEDARRALVEYLTTLPPGPFGAPNRFRLVAAVSQDRSALRGLGTYGFIKGAPGFIIGAAGQAEKNLEDFGYRMEQIILFATDLGLGTCWLGGTFTRSSFARRISASKEEIIPAVCAIGYPARGSDVPQNNGARSRLDWDALFFDEKFGSPLPPEVAGDYALPLEMVRLAPSASNKQPWRMVRQGNRWHFYMQRTQGYREMGRFIFLRIADMQRVDLGIALCHFGLAAAEAGLQGRWEIAEPALQKPDGLTEYVSSWVAQPA
jgi:nitroreductase